MTSNVSSSPRHAREITVDSITVLIFLLVGAAAATFFSWLGFAVFVLAFLFGRVIATLWWNRV